MKQNLKKINLLIKQKIGKILILFGIIFLLSAIFMKGKAEYIQQKKIQEYQSYIKSLTENTEINLENPDKNEILMQEEPQESSSIGILSIPVIDVYTTIEEGTNKETLKYAVGHFEGTAMPGEVGNCAITGHRSYTYGEYFNRLDEVEIGDSIIIQREKQEFCYKVKEIFIVEPTELSVLENTEEAILTLITCTPIRIATHRLIIKAVLEKE